MTALWAHSHVLAYQFFALGACLGSGFALAFLGFAWRLNGGNWAMRCHVASEVQHQAVGFTIGGAQSTPCHLQVKSRRQRRAQHGDQINARRIESGC